MVVGDPAVPNKDLGQHWLFDTSILQAMCISVDASQGDRVLEIGPGLGTLTKQLLESGCNVTAVEFDRQLAKKLTKQFAQNTQVNVIEADIRKFNFMTMEAPYKLCANIPYYLTSNLMRILCDTPNKPESAALLMQKEVAERIVAQKKRGILSVFVQYHYNVSLGEVVPPHFFSPPPSVDSQILILHKRVTPYFDADQKILARLIKAGFSEKRKTLRNALKGGLAIDAELALKLLEQARISPERRAESLSLDEWKDLYQSYFSLMHR